MSMETVSIRLPISLYADLRSLAEVEQADPVETIARLVATAQRRVRSSADGGEVTLKATALSSDERARRLQIVQRLYGLWSQEDEAAFERTRQELWSQWQPRNFAWTQTQ